MGTKFKLHKTRFTGLKFMHVIDGVWRFVDVHDREPVTWCDCRCVGPQYASKDELLADADRYAKESWGY